MVTEVLQHTTVLLDEAVLTANISDNTSRSAFTVINKAKGKTVARR